ncbi:hypothetical protein D3C87_1825080 [compost metagenome]
MIVTHLSSVLQVANLLLLLYAGRQQAFGPRAEVLAAMRRATRAPSAQARPPDAAPPDAARDVLS